jgi:hypothetical protein
MEKFKINESKKESYSGKADKKGEYLGTIKVNKAKYVPTGVKVRSWIDDFIFTAVIPANVLEELDKNELITSFSLNKRLNMI